MKQINYCECQEYELKNYLNLPGEKLIIAKRQHWFILVSPILLTLAILILTSLFFIVLISYTNSLTHPILIIVSVALLCFIVISKLIVDWYYHLYVITNRKILEIRISPLFADEINDVFLDQVRTTEVDAAIGSFLNELLDMGSITISFDRPSKDKVFILHDIINPREVGIFLGDELEKLMHTAPVWFQKDKTPEHIKYTEDVIPKEQQQGATII